jgi:hypothetical protein
VASSAGKTNSGIVARSDQSVLSSSVSNRS